jgi:ABC-type nitrate/sulfonate/bicarbonate transport system ATPase subunit
MKTYQKGQTILKVENVSLNLGGNQILKDVNVEIKDITRPNVTTGQIVGFLGPSGIGKTKLFEILSGLLQPTSGAVLIGDPLTPVQAGMVGVVQQNYPLFNHRTIEGNLMVAAKKQFNNDSECKDRLYVMLERFGMKDKARMYPSQLSGGQRQRVAIAQQMLCSKHFLLLDEPFSGLDINMLQEVQEMVAEIANSHELNTVIIVSHDIISTAAIADTLWVMGRDRDAKNQIIPGSKIKHTYDLIEKDLCWEKDIINKSDFQALIKEVRGLFHSL